MSFECVTILSPNSFIIKIESVSTCGVVDADTEKAGCNVPAVVVLIVPVIQAFAVVCVFADVITDVVVVLDEVIVEVVAVAKTPFAATALKLILETPTVPKNPKLIVLLTPDARLVKSNSHINS